MSEGQAPVAAADDPAEAVAQRPPAPHRWEVAERELRRHEARRGRRHAYEALDPRRTALVVVDMIPFFVADSTYARGIVANVNALASALRQAGGTVAWVLPAVVDPPSRWATGFYGPTVASRYAGSGGRGPLASRLWHELRAEPDDVLVEKSAPSACFPGRCPLPDELARRRIDTVVVAGTVTSVCCESTARDAATLGYCVVLVADATADVDDAAHNAALRTVHRSFGDVRPTAAVIDLLAEGDRSGGRSVP